MKVPIDSDVYAGDPTRSLGLPSSTVAIPDELGPMPAWVVPGRSGTRAIVVHGINSTTETGLRVTPALHRAGAADAADPLSRGPRRPAQPRRLPPHGPDRVARPRRGRPLRARPRRPAPGPDRVLDRRRDRQRVHAALAAGPALHQPRARRARPSTGRPSSPSTRPRSAAPLRRAAGRVGDRRPLDADWDSLDALRHPEDLQLPIQLFHGGEDDVVPIATSETSPRSYRVRSPATGPQGGSHRDAGTRPGTLERRLRDPPALPQEIGGR